MPADECHAVSLRKLWVEELFAQAWIRTWRGSEATVPEWFPHGLEMARPSLGYGVVDPIEMRIDGSQMTLICPGTGRTLAEYFTTTFEPNSEQYSRFLLEQVCYGALRVHDGLESVHGALTPFNIQVPENYMLKLWSVPTARLELSFGKTDREWENPYRSPQVRDGETPTVADDVYSLGMLFARLLLGTRANFDTWCSQAEQTLGTSQQSIDVLTRATDPDRDRRYQSVREMMADLDPESDLLSLDIVGANEDNRLGAKAFSEQRLGLAKEHFQDAHGKDWLGISGSNNLAVVEAAHGNFEKGLEHLGRAFKLAPQHPLLDTNRGFCLLKCGDLASAEFWLLRANGLNPKLIPAIRGLAEKAQQDGDLERALGYAQNCVAVEPKSRSSRLLLADLLDDSDPNEASIHREYAESLEVVPFLFDHLLTTDNPPPWMLYLNGENDTVMRRFDLVRSRPDYRKIVRSITLTGQLDKLSDT